MRKKFLWPLYISAMAIFVLFSLGGCHSSDDAPSSGSSENKKLVVISTPSFKINESYLLFMGDQVSVEGTDAKYYVAPRGTDELVTMNLEFSDILSWDAPFVITREEDNNVVFSYNPEGGEDPDLTTEYGDVVRVGGNTQQLRYTGLGVTGATLDYGDDEVVINLDYDVAEIEDYGDIDEYSYVWHAEPDYYGPYYTENLNSTTKYSEDEIKAKYPVPDNGIYIAHDIAYTPNTLSFQLDNTAVKDEESEYVVYYSDEVSAQAAAADGLTSGKYIFATLPKNSQGGGNRPDGNMPDGNRPDGNQPNQPRAAASDNSSITAFSTMTHSASDAYKNPVLHINQAGTYRLKGTWHGQIWLDPGEDEIVTVILDGVDVSCDVAPALVFHDVYECGPKKSADIVSFDVGPHVYDEAGARVILANGSTNNFTGANVYRILKPEKKSSATKVDGTDISDQKKMYKMDGAFYSFASMVIGAESNRGGGRLNITSTTYEGLDAEYHMLIDSGTINVTAEDDGINVNEDNVSVFTMDGGSLTVVAKNGDGIDSNGYIVINGGTLNITAVRNSDELNAGADGPLDADLGVYMDESVTYSHSAYTGQTNTGGGDSGNSSGNNSGSSSTNPYKKAVSYQDEDENVVLRVSFSQPEKDTDKSNRNVSGSSDVFKLTHQINNFGGIRLKTK